MSAASLTPNDRYFLIRAFLDFKFDEKGRRIQKTSLNEIAELVFTKATLDAQACSTLSKEIKAKAKISKENEDDTLIGTLTLDQKTVIARILANAPFALSELKLEDFNLSDARYALALRQLNARVDETGLLFNESTLWSTICAIVDARLFSEDEPDIQKLFKACGGNLNNPETQTTLSQEQRERVAKTIAEWPLPLRKPLELENEPKEMTKSWVQIKITPSLLNLAAQDTTTAL